MGSFAGNWGPFAAFVLAILLLASLGATGLATDLPSPILDLLFKAVFDTPSS